MGSLGLRVVCGGGDYFAHILALTGGGRRCTPRRSCSGTADAADAPIRVEYNRAHHSLIFAAAPSTVCFFASLELPNRKVYCCVFFSSCRFTPGERMPRMPSLSGSSSSAVRALVHLFF